MTEYPSIELKTCLAFFLTMVPYCIVSLVREHYYKYLFQINIPETMKSGDMELFQIRLGTALDSLLYLSREGWT